MANAWLYFLVCLLLVGGLTLFVTQERIYRPLLTRPARLSRLEPLVRKGLTLLDTSRRLLTPAPFVIGLGIAIVSWACEGWALYLVLDGFGLAVPLLTAFSIYGLATVVGAASMLPGGLGGFEAVMLLMLTTLRISPAAAVAPLVLIRFSTLWFGSLVGFGFMGGWWLLAGPTPSDQLLP